MNKVILLTALVVLSGCINADAIRDAISKEGADVMDQLLTDTEWFMCYGASIGSVKRKYGGDKADAYNALCKVDSSKIVIVPES